MLCIIDYGSGNISAIVNICKREHIDYMVASNPKDLNACSHFLLPGVGAFDPTIEILESSGLLLALEEQVVELKKPVLGICVGMQLLADSSEEGQRPGLGWISGKIRKIDSAKIAKPPYIPHMGWNSISINRSSLLLSSIDVDIGFYFLHSYYFDAGNENDVLAKVDFAGGIPCVVNRDNIYGTQFHPEKSHANGIQLIKNFAGIT